MMNIQAMQMKRRIEALTDGIITDMFFSKGYTVQADEALVGLT